MRTRPAAFCSWAGWPTRRSDKARPHQPEAPARGEATPSLALRVSVAPSLALRVGFIGHIGGEVLQKVPAIAASTGSACHEGHISVSPVLKAMKVPVKSAQGAVRLSVGRYTTEDEIDLAAAALRQALLGARN